MWGTQLNFTINNIQWTFKYQPHEMVSEDENLGLADLMLPGPMGKRFLRECGEDGAIPYYDKEMTSDYLSQGEHACYNSDTQIVLMSWLFGKQRRYNLEYIGLDPFWVFHDSCHAENDVHSNKIYVNSEIEYQRIMDGAARAKKAGYSIMPETAFKLLRTWDQWFRRREGADYKHIRYEDFMRLLETRDKYILDAFIKAGQTFYLGSYDRENFSPFYATNFI